MNIIDTSFDFDRTMWVKICTHRFIGIRDVRARCCGIAAAAAAAAVARRTKPSADTYLCTALARVFVRPSSDTRVRASGRIQISVIIINIGR